MHAPQEQQQQQQYNTTPFYNSPARRGALFQPRQARKNIPQKYDLFPRKFVKGYGAPKPVGDDIALLSKLKPENCEWFGRADMAFSFFGDTVQQCLPILNSNASAIFTTEITDTFNDLLTPLYDSFQHLNNNEQDSRPTQKDV